MIRHVLLLALLGLSLTSVFAAEAPETARYARKCPCKCYTGFNEWKASEICRKPEFGYKCKTFPCTSKYHFKGRACCDRHYHPEPVYHPPKPSKSPSPKPKIVCPCRCEAKGKAKRACRYTPYKPYCKLIECPSHHSPHGYGYYKPKPKFQCCYKPHYRPRH